MSTTRDLANAIRFLSIDAVEKANSGHPGMPMGMADIAEVLWRHYLKHNPKNPNWINRDRFVLSNGHGSMLLYSLLHLTGYELTIDDLKNFRQLNSKTPGHPEFGFTVGVETTSGPLGQGLATAVGMALAEKVLSAQFNRPGYNIIDHYTYVFCGDGCLMEGISHEAASLAGTHKLGKLIMFWDNNGISIDGHVHGWFTDNTPERFAAYGWHVVRNVNGHDPEEIHNAIKEAHKVNDKPTLICCSTTIAYGAPKLHDSNKAHGSPLGAAEVAATRANLNWQYPPFVIPPEIYTQWNASPKGTMVEKHWQEQFAKYAEEFPELANELNRRLDKILPADWDTVKNQHLQMLLEKNESIATRKASQNCLNAYGPIFSELLGGSADLSESNLTEWVGSKDITATNAAGNYIHYGVREFAMFAMSNGVSLHGGFIPYCGTFLVFADYGLNAIRLSSLMHQKVIFVLTHDSIGLGEDGPTHQPTGQLAALRTIPDLSVWRPCDTIETAIAWQFALEHHGQTCLILTRQKVAGQQHQTENIENIKRGGYIIFEPANKNPQAIIIATGSEVDLAVKAAKQMETENINVRVVSMPSIDVFLQQEKAYRKSVLPKNIKARLAIEAGNPDLWYKFVGLEGEVIGLSSFGQSAPAEKLFEFFGFSVENVIDHLKQILQ